MLYSLLRSEMFKSTFNINIHFIVQTFPYLVGNLFDLNNFDIEMRMNSDSKKDQGLIYNK